jgi:predicted 2-oxoglutarate/Fe(II)-dependent dioxygenase YbiX
MLPTPGHGGAQSPYPPIAAGYIPGGGPALPWAGHAETALHHVTPVMRGVCPVTVTRLQSAIRDPAQREARYDLGTAHRSLFARQGKAREVELIAKAPIDRVRLWAEP